MGQYSSGLPNMWRFGEDMQKFERLSAKLLNKVNCMQLQEEKLGDVEVLFAQFKRGKHYGRGGHTQGMWQKNSQIKYYLFLL